MTNEPSDLTPPGEGDEQEKATEEEAAPEEGAPEPPPGTFDMDPALAAAMADADAAYAKRKAEASGEVFVDESDDDEGEEIPIEAPSRAPPLPSGAGEGTIRALAQLKETMERLEQVEAEKKQLEERLLRARADLENYKKRAQREVEQERKFANEKLLKELFPVMDNMERAIDATENTTLEAYAQGLEMVEKSFMDALARFGVEKFSCLHEPFDPERMEAMQQMESADHPPGTVVMEYMKGYLLKGRLVRPSMVVVSKAPAGAPLAAEGQPDQDQGGAPSTDEASAAAAGGGVDAGTSDAAGENEGDG
ncbi:MAG: nucleotide exchange factor GrpE [Deltaproteobacteria bacterium]|nr:nucleotide exchange factor GrpE [Deltaproteobacteria bacterium]